MSEYRGFVCWPYNKSTYRQTASHQSPVTDAKITTCLFSRHRWSQSRHIFLSSCSRIEIRTEGPPRSLPKTIPAAKRHGNTVPRMRFELFIYRQSATNNSFLGAINNILSNSVSKSSVLFIFRDFFLNFCHQKEFYYFGVSNKICL